MRAAPTEAIPDCLPGTWWVAHTRPRAEKALTLDLRNLDITAYLPLCSRETRSSTTGRKSRSIVPVFTGYVFFNATPDQRYRALNTNRIAQTLPVPGQHELVGHLRQIQRVLADGTEFRLRKALEVGQWVRVAAGSLAGVEGIVSQRRSRLRLVLNVATLGQSVSVEVDQELLEEIPAPSFAPRHP